MDDKAKRTALRMFTYGLYVLGTEHDGKVGCATVTWVSQASFDPPLVMLGVKKDGWPYQLLKESGRFAISILGSEQEGIARAFFKPPRPENGKLAGYGYRVGRSPVLTDALAWLEADLVSVDETGDHAVVVGQVVEAGVHREGDPLTLRQLGLNYGG